MGLQRESGLLTGGDIAESYEGDEMMICPLDFTDFNHCCAVIVSGYGPNFCGHTLLHVGDSWYFHVAGGSDA